MIEAILSTFGINYKIQLLKCIRMPIQGKLVRIFMSTQRRSNNQWEYATYNSIVEKLIFTCITIIIDYYIIKLNMNSVTLMKWEEMLQLYVYYMYVHSKWKMNQKIYLVFIKNFHYIFSCPETFWSPCGCLLVHVHFTSCRHEPLPLPSPPCWTQIFYPMNKSTSKYWPWLTTFFFSYTSLAAAVMRFP